MKKRSGDGTGGFKVEMKTNTAKFSNTIISRFRESRYLARESKVFMCSSKMKPRKRGNCECIATWGSPMPHRSLSALIMTPIPSLKFELAQLTRCRRIAFLLLIRYVTLWPWTLTPWPWPFTLNMYSRPDSLRSNPVPNLSAIEQSAAKLLRFEYLTLWPWTCIKCCTMLWDSLHKV